MINLAIKFKTVLKFKTEEQKKSKAVEKFEAEEQNKSKEAEKFETEIIWKTEMETK